MLQNIFNNTNTVEMDVDELYLLVGDEPTNFAEVEPHACWRHAMLEEMESIEENDTWSLIDLPVGHHPLA